jgi:hypothetical protein
LLTNVSNLGLRMVRYFFPVSDNHPQTVEVNGHRLLILTSDKADLTDSQDFIGNDTVKEIFLDSEQDEKLADLAQEVNGGLVFAPAGMDVEQMIHSLETELPWVH